MKHAEEVTFGGSGLERASGLRADPAAMAQMRAHPGAVALVFWQGKPLICGPDRNRLVVLPLDHPLLQIGGIIKEPLFLGLEDDAPTFACDISDWRPEDLDPDAMQQFVDPSVQHHPMLPPDHVFAELRLIMAALSPRAAELIASAKAAIGWHATHKFCARCGAETHMTQGGWQRQCDACGGQHFPRTDPVVIMLITHENSVLVGRSPGWPEGMFSLLAGFVEPGETLEAAVRREVKEEAGVEVGAVGYLASQPWPFPSSLMIGCHGQALSRDIEIDPKEIEEAMWVTREEMMDALAGQHPVIKPARKGAIAHFLLVNWVADKLD